MKVNKEVVKSVIHEINPAKLVAATKYVTISEIVELEKYGVTIFGENRVQALLDKYDAYQGNGQFHMIGTLQKNKVKYIIDKVKLIHSVDTRGLLGEIQKQAEKKKITMPILLQVNIAKEESKHGFTVTEIYEVMESMKAYPNIQVKGLMMMAPNLEEEIIEPYFKRTQQLLQDLQKKYPDNNISELSMGMSNDYHIALKYGATYIRIGSLLFNK